MLEDLNYSYYDWRNGELVIGKERLGMSFRVFYALKWMDGKTTNLEIRKKFKKRFNLELSGSDLRNIIKKSKDSDLLIDKRNGCLISKLSDDFINRQIKLFSRKKIRPAQYAGVCYSDKKEELERSVLQCFDSIDLMSFKNRTKGINRLKGIIVPHSNLELSGSCAAWAYKAVEEKPLPELLIILAPDHSRVIKTPFSISNQNYGILENVVKVDNEFIKLLKKDINFNIFDNNISHLIEHAVEIQLPFLLYIFRKNPEKLKILPIICASEPKYDKKEKCDFRVKQEIFLDILKKALYKTGKDVIFIATGDLMHIREKEAIPQFHKKNKEIISLLQETNAENLKLKLNPEYSTCGKWSFYNFLRLIEPVKSRVLNYSWVGKYNTANKSYRNFVNIGYVSMIFY